jgi:hypothetical protein
MKNNSDYFDIRPNERELNEFIDVLKRSVDYERIEHESIDEDGKKVVTIQNIHWLGSKILTNRDMMIMCSEKFGNDYEFMTYAEQRKLREHIFEKLRGDKNG